MAFSDHFGSRAREVPSAELVGDDDPEAEVSPEDVAAVLRILRANGLGLDEVDLTVESNGHPNGRPAGHRGAGEAAG